MRQTVSYRISVDNWVLVLKKHAFSTADIVLLPPVSTHELITSILPSPSIRCCTLLALVLPSIEHLPVVTSDLQTRPKTAPQRTSSVPHKVSTQSLLKVL